MSFGAYGVMPIGGDLDGQWPSPQLGADLDYSWNVEADLVPIGDSIASVALNISPSGSGEMQPVDMSANGYLVTAQLSGGVAGRNYIVQIIVNTTSGRTFPYLIGVSVSAALATYPLPPAPSTSFGSAITWSAGVTVFGPAFAAVATGLIGTGTNQATALPLIAATNVISSVPAGTGFVLTDNIVSGTLSVQNDDPTNTGPVYPPIGGQINELGTNIPFVVGANGARIQFTTQNPATQWYAG